MTLLINALLGTFLLNAITQFFASSCLVWHYVALFVILCLSGILGGLGRGAYDWLKDNENDVRDGDEKKRKCGRTFWRANAMLGIAGAGGGVCITLMFSKYELKIDQLHSVILYTAIAIFCGLLAKSLLPSVEDKINQAIKNVKVDVKDSVAADVKTGISDSQKRTDSLIDIIASADDTIAFVDKLIERDKKEGKNFAELRTELLHATIDRMEAEKTRYKDVRSFNIKLGRLYRRLAENEKQNFSKHINKAIEILEDFQKAIAEKKETWETKNAVAAAKFNIACYLSLKSRRETNQKNKDTLREKIITLLKKSIELDPRIRVDIQTDDDLDEDLKLNIKS